MSIASRLHRWWATLGRRDEFSELSDFEVSRIATDVGVSAPELHELSLRGPDAGALLPRRLRALDLDPTKLAHERPAEFRDMQRLCSLCESEGRCEHDLSQNVPGDWHTYCPNASAIRALRVAYEA